MNKCEYSGQSPVDISASDYENQSTLLHVYSIDPSKIPICRLLVQRKADVSQPDENGMTPLHFASGGNNREGCALLLEQGADINSADRYKRTPLYMACRESNCAIAQFLLDKGASTDVKDVDGYSFLDVACNRKSPELCSLPVQLGRFGRNS